MGALRDGDLKLVVMGESDWARQMMPGEDRSDQLFDLARDPARPPTWPPSSPRPSRGSAPSCARPARDDEVGRIFKEGDRSYWTP